MTVADPQAESPAVRAEQLRKQRLANLAKGRETLAKRKREKALASSANGDGQPAEVSGPQRTLDEIATKHAGRTAGPPAPERHGAPIASIEEVAQGTHLYSSGRDPVPPPENYAALSPGMTSELESHVPDYAGDSEPQSFDEIFEHYDFDGSGSFYVSVDRKSPRAWGGVSCGGMQRPISRHMTRDEFAYEYGGGDYRLIVHGPPRAGSLRDPRTGRPRRKVLTKAIKVELSVDHYPVNLDSGMLDGTDFGDEDGGESMQQHPFRANGGRRPNSTADARMHEANLAHDERLREREDRIRREAAASGNATQSQMPVMMRMVTDSMGTQMHAVREEAARREQILQRELKEREARASRLEQKMEARAQRPNDTESLGTALSAIISAMKQGGDDGAAAALEQARNELTRMTEKHAGEVQRLSQDHQNEIRRVAKDQADSVQRLRDDHDKIRERDARAQQDDTKRAEDRVRDERERADKRIEDADKRAERTVKEITERYEKLLREAREDAQRRIEETRTSMQQRIDDQQRQHDRDIKQNDKGWDTRLAGLKDMYENRVTALGQEITRERGETTRYREEAEKNKDIVGKVSEVREVASLLGMSDGSAPAEDLPKDWKGLLMLVARDVVQKLPDTIASAGETVRSLRQPGQAAAMQQMDYAAMQPRQLAGPVPPPLRGRDGGEWAAEPLEFGTEDGPNYGADRTGVSPPQPTAQREQTPEGQVFAPVQPIPNQSYPSPSQPVVAPPAQQAASPPAPQQPAAARPPPQQPAAQQPAQQPMEISDEQIAQFAPVLGQAFEEGAPPGEFAADFIGEVGDVMARRIALSLNPQRVAAVLLRTPQGASHPLVRREGQRYLGELVRLILQYTEPGA